MRDDSSPGRGRGDLAEALDAAEAGRSIREALDAATGTAPAEPDPGGDFF